MGRGCNEETFSRFNFNALSLSNIWFFKTWIQNHTCTVCSDDYILPGESDEDDADSKKKVNYGYHPIIDFFPMYRWSAAAAAAAAARK